MYLILATDVCRLKSMLGSIRNISCSILYEHSLILSSGFELPIIEDHFTYKCIA